MDQIEKFLADYRRQENNRKWISVAPNGAIVIEYGKRPLIGTVVATYEEALTLSNTMHVE